MIGTLDYADISKVRKRISEFSLLEPMKPWPYAKLIGPGGEYTMRLSGGRYYRDNGEWGISFRVKDDRIFAVATYAQVQHLHGQEFFEISAEEWAEENRDYDRYESPDLDEDIDEDEEFEDELPDEENFL